MGHYLSNTVFTDVEVNLALWGKLHVLCEVNRKFRIDDLQQVLRLKMDEICSLAAKSLNKQLLTADKVWYSYLVG